MSPAACYAALFEWALREGVGHRNRPCAVISAASMRDICGGALRNNTFGFLTWTNLTR
jgi:hypothetical protein